MNKKNGTHLVATEKTAVVPGASQVTDPARRRFLKLSGGVLGLLTLLEIGGAGMIYLQPRQTKSSFGTVVNAGLVDEFPPGSVSEFIDGRFFLIRAADGGFLALYRRCPHLGCTINWHNESEVFICPCHASSFDFYGNFNHAPVPRSMDTFAITIEAQQIFVDTSHLHTREAFQPEQLAYS